MKAKLLGIVLVIIFLVVFINPIRNELIYLSYDFINLFIPDPPALTTKNIPKSLNLTVNDKVIGKAVSMLVLPTNDKIKNPRPPKNNIISAGPSVSYYFSSYRLKIKQEPFNNVCYNSNITIDLKDVDPYLRDNARNIRYEIFDDDDLVYSYVNLFYDNKTYINTSYLEKEKDYFVVMFLDAYGYTVTYCFNLKII